MVWYEFENGLAGSSACQFFYFILFGLISNLKKISIVYDAFLSYFLQISSDYPCISLSIFIICLFLLMFLLSMPSNKQIEGCLA